MKPLGCHNISCTHSTIDPLSYLVINRGEHTMSASSLTEEKGLACRASCDHDTEERFDVGDGQLSPGKNKVGLLRRHMILLVQPIYSTVASQETFRRLSFRFNSLRA